MIKNIRNFGEHYDTFCYNALRSENCCVSISAFFLAYINKLQLPCRPDMCYKEAGGVNLKDTKEPLELLIEICHVFCTVLSTLIAIAMARLFIYKIFGGEPQAYWWRYVLEFALIVIPTITSINGCNSYINYIIGVFGVLLLLSTCWTNGITEYLEKRHFEFGRKPQIITLLRSSINYLTALCILAVDFEYFPKSFRKTRYYGVGLMDVGIGLYVFSMGLVSQRLHRFGELRKLVIAVCCLLILGLVRTLVISAVNYRQDEHEYGVHLNAFFILGFTKLLGVLISTVANTDRCLLLMALGILSVHEVTLQCGISEFVMNEKIERNSFVTANREGLCCLIGFISIYLVASYIGNNVKSKETLNFSEIISKVKLLFLASAITWISVVFSIYTTSIARVTCNFGYVMWILSLAITMLLLYLITFDIVLDTLWPFTIDRFSISNRREKHLNPKIPIIMESINKNGLIYFLLANVLTGLINIYLEPDQRSNFESIIILLAYMFVINSVTFILYKFELRIV